MNSVLTANIVGHLVAAPRTFNLRDGVGCELRVLVTLSYYDSAGIPTTRERRVKVVTYSLVEAERLVRDYKLGDFVQIYADDARVERAWQSQKGEWVSGSLVFSLAKIRKVSATTPETGRPAAAPAEAAPPADSRPAATDAAAEADATILAGVTA